MRVFSTWELIALAAGTLLASPACYSFQTKSGLFLRHRGWRVRVDLNTGDANFRTVT